MMTLLYLVLGLASFGALIALTAGLGRDRNNQ